jgi:acyl-CoA reductase-like NAD-dependent aldehyde dehydrogenase
MGRDGRFRRAKGGISMRCGRQKMLIGGEWVPGTQYEVFPTIDPGNGEVLAEVACGHEADIHQAVEAAQHALDRTGWISEPPRIRAQTLNRIAHLIREHKAMQIANDTPFGLVAGIWTRDISRAHTLAARLKPGQIYINNFFGGGIAAPFGGYKKSGFGREKGLEALQHYTQVKNVCVALD